MFGADFKDEARRPATVGQSEAGRKHLAFLQNVGDPKEVMTILKRCDSTMTKWARRGYLVPSMVGGKHLYRKADVMRILNGGRM